MQSQLPPDFKEIDDFLLVSTVKLEPKLDKALYPSCLHVFQITETKSPVTDQQGNQHLQKSYNRISRHQMPQKRLISCLKAYRGHLISVQNVKADFQIVLQSMKLKMDDGQQPQTMQGTNAANAYEANAGQDGVRYFIDPVQSGTAQMLPNSIQNMARFISVELEDYIIIGDIYKNFQIFKPKNAQELANDRIEDKSRISLKPRFQSKLDANCIGVYCFGVNQAMQGEEMKKCLEVDPTCDLK